MQCLHRARHLIHVPNKGRHLICVPNLAQVRPPLPLPPKEELQAWMPSERFPSDHLSLVFDFDWRPHDASQLQEQQHEDAGGADPGPGLGAAAGGPQHGAGGSSRSSIIVASSAVAEQPQRPSGGSLESSSNADTADHCPAFNNDVPGSAVGAFCSLGHRAASSAKDCGLEATPATEMEPAGSGQGLEVEGAGQAGGVVLPADDRGTEVAAECLSRGGVVAVPTDTLYGLATCANSGKACIRPSLNAHKLPFLCETCIGG
jgi:2',5'-phosphodiesterase